MNNLGDLFHLEPALVVGFTGALLGLGVAFGLPITQQQKMAILEFAGPAYLMAGALVVRKKSMPVKTMEDAGVNVQAVKDQAAVYQEVERQAQAAKKS